MDENTKILQIWTRLTMKPSLDKILLRRFIHEWKVERYPSARRVETISAQMIYLVTELRVEGGETNQILPRWSWHYRRTCGNRTIAYRRYYKISL